MGGDVSPKPRSGQQGSAVLRTPAASTRPTARTCSTCQQPTLEARTPNGLDVVVDAAPLSAIGELQALLGGARTYTHHVVLGDLAHRYPLVIRSRPAGTAPRQTVHASHRCGDTWPALEHWGPPAAAAIPDADPPY